MSNRNANTSKRPAVLVLGDDTRNLLPIVRSLGRQGICVHLGWCEPGDPVLCSRYLHRLERLPAYSRHDHRWLDGLRTLLRRRDFELVIPATEGAVFALQEHRHEIDHLAPIYLLEQDTFETVFDKSRTYALARSVGAPVPESRMVGGLDEVDALRGSLALPAVVKPCSSVRQQQVLTKNYVRTVRDFDELRAYAGRLLEREPQVILQECLPGHGVGVEVLAERGRLLFAFQHVRLHETSGYGSTYRMSTPLEAELLEAAEKLIGALDYTGVAMVEFRVDPATGRWALLEINGRFWGSLPLSVAAGADFPWYLYQLLVHRQRDFPQGYRSGVRSRHLTLDARWLWRTLRRKHPEVNPRDETRLAWAVNRVPLWRAAGHTLRGLLGLDCIDTFAWDDPRPLRAELVRLLRAVLRRGPSSVAAEVAGPEQADLGEPVAAG